MKRGEDEVDLSLSLFIGSNVFRTKPASPPSDTTSIRSDESNGLDSLKPQRKRFLFALRRQEAKKKRIEKKQQQLNRSNGIPVNSHTCNGNMLSEGRAAKNGRFGNFDQMQYPSFSMVPVPMPCWAPNAAANASPSISGVGPYGLNSGFPEFERSDSKQNGSSSISSAVSDAQSASLHGSSGSHSRSHSSCTSFKKLKADNQPQESARAVEHTKEKLTTWNTMNSISTTAKTISTPSSLTKHPHSPTQREGNKENLTPLTPSLSQMPCVWTTGDGPNGKTVTGFLYRCTKTEISIICVCHGISFSPTEFVSHAGGTDISHPLRHIVVVPSLYYPLD
ncbi:ninja-family protein 2-like [Magnolia sinica]|uniref:ninja-family protein 2-like n=1 Tax=Magnolia sinica TaxID=86752 RepID=UPI00265B4E28|nr:ninja-family protein 2-like [Magnolia sinica]